MVTIETLRDGLGAEVFRVSRIFPNAASAMRAVALLKSVTPEAFVPVAEPAPEPRVLRPLLPSEWLGDLPFALEGTAGKEVPLTYAPLPDPEREDDTGEPYTVPGCASGMCGMD